MSDFTDINLSAKCNDIVSARETIMQVFQQNGFYVEWLGEHAGKAKKGSTAMNFLFGAIAQAYEIYFQIYNAPDQALILRVIKSSSGWMGGFWGYSKTKAEYTKIVAMLSNNFYSKSTCTPTSPPTATQYICPSCGQPIVYYRQYQRWYCHNEKKYL